MKLKDNKDRIDKFFDSKSEEELENLWQKYAKTVKLEQNEVIVKDFRVLNNCLSTDKTKTDVMISFTKQQEEFDYIDMFFTKEQIIELRDRLTKHIDTEFSTKIKPIY